MFRLDNRVQPYAWGTTDAIARLLGLPEDGPKAELWIGAHPAAPSQTLSADGSVATLTDIIASDPERHLGPERASDRLGFLLKILSAGAPLSLQAHPDAATAARRFREEEATGVPLDAPHRLYRDDQHKPEVLYALEPFSAMAGFRAPADARALLTRLNLTSLDAEPRALLDALLDDLFDSDESAALADATERMLTAPSSAVAPLVDAVANACVGVDDDSARCVMQLAEQYPGDAGVLVSILLNKVVLQAGEALFLPAGNIHAYLSGTGVELMASSDNVLRGGLTPKHVDAAELLRVLDFRVLPAPVLTARPVPGDEEREVFTPEGVHDFALVVLDLEERAVPQRFLAEVPRTVLCLSGEARLETATDAVVLTQGESVFVAAMEGPLTVRGSGRTVLASPGGTSAGQ